MTDLVSGLLTVPAPVAYLVITALVFGEAALFVGFVLPGETAVLLGGVLASTGRLSVVTLMATVVLAAVLGDSVGFEVGRRFGPRLLRVRLLRRHQGRLESARGLLRERGAWAVLVGRFTAFLRAVTPALAGLSGMRYRRFLAFNVTGGLLWGVGAVLLGYLAGASYQRVEGYLGTTSLAVIAVVVAVGLGAWWWRRRREAHRSRAGSPSSSGSCSCQETPNRSFTHPNIEPRP